jgi:hypothetical protein
LCLPVLLCLSDLSFPQVNKYILKQYRSEQIKDLGILFALSKEGSLEQPPKSNKGKDVNEFLSSVNLKSGNEWCVAFCQWAYRKAAALLHVNFNMILSGHSLSVLSYARNNGIEALGSIERGDWIIFRRGKPYPLRSGNIKGHCGIVLSYDGNIIYTIEGNISNPSGDNQGVFKRFRKLNQFGWLQIAGFIGFK